MQQNERWVVAAILMVIAVFIGTDIFKDAHDGVMVWHTLVEGLVAGLALVGVYFLLRNTFSLRHELRQEIKNFSEFRIEVEAWKTESKKYIEGLSRAIDLQLEKWQLTTAEKEVAFLLLKGLSLKEIAQVRDTSEKTTRIQSMAIYAKSKLSGRSELAAFFLEDLLVPSDERSST